MTDASYVGAVIMEVNGREVEIVSIKPSVTPGRQPVKAMNRHGRVGGYADGVKEYKLSVSAVVPLDGSVPDWENITKAKITVFPLEKNEQRTSYLDCFTLEVSEQYEVDNEARIDIEMQALRKVKE